MPCRAQLIVLVGPMGVGKSTVGRLLANLLGLSFYDSDREIERQAGTDIGWIFDREGEQGFRDRETAVLTELMAHRSMVLATGGGVVMRKENRELLKQANNTCYLMAEPKLLVERTKKNNKRPLLQVDDPAAKILSLLQERDPLYREVATITVATDSRSPKSTALELMLKLKSK
jgi:shikimate kinase